MRFRLNQKAGVAILALVCLVLPMRLAHADGIFSIGSYASSAVVDIITFSLSTIFGLVGKLIAIMAHALNYAVFTRAGGDIPVVAATWKILRDFSNMFFIIALIYMAFATIFDYGKYRFQDMIVRFVIVALLINFSMVIGNMVIDACQVLSNIFLGSIGNLGDRLGSFLNPAALLPGGLNPADLASGQLISLLFALILALIMLFSMLVATAFAIIRVPYIWALLIVSPLAWMCNIFPGTKKWWTMWWSQFRGWNLFLPVYLFFMYLGLLFLSKRDEIILAVVGHPANDPLLGGLTNTLTFNLLFFYIFAAFVLIGGTKAAVATTSLMGSGFDKGARMARSVVGRITKYDSHNAALRGAIDQRKSQFLQEGFKTPWLNKVYGGRESDQRKQTRYARFLGVRGAGKELNSEIDKEVGKLKEYEKLGKIQVNEAFKTAAAKESNTSARGLAMRSLLYERGMIDEKEFAKDMSSWSQSNPLLAQSMAEKAKKGKYKSVKPEELLKMAAAEGQYSSFRNPESTVLRKEWFDFLKDNDKAVGGMTLSQYETAISLRGGSKTNDAAEYRKAIGKKRPDLLVDFDMKEKKIAKDPRVRSALLMKELKDKKATDIAQISDKAWSDPDFVQAIELNMRFLDKNDPPAAKGDILPNGKKATKNYAGGGANFKASLRKSAARSGAKLKILRALRPEELGGEIADEAPEKGVETPKKESDAGEAKSDEKGT